MRSLIIIFILCSLASCSKKEPEKVAEAIDLALSYLTEEKCQEAIDVLEDVELQTSDAIYLQVLASAYACRAGFDEISFITDDIPSLDTSPSTDLYKSLSIMSLSNETETDSDEYTDIWTGLNLLLYSDGGTQPSQTFRETTYGTRKAGDMGMQALLLAVTQLGKFLNHFGNVDASGVKSLGDGTNSCFLNYTYASAQTVITALPVANNCNANNDGHTDLDLTTDAGKTRACEGLILFTNILDILDNLDLSSSDELDDLSSVSSTISTYKTTAIAADPSLATLLDITSQEVCEETLETASEVNNMQLIYALIFESGLQ